MVCCTPSSPGRPALASHPLPNQPLFTQRQSKTMPSSRWRKTLTGLTCKFAASPMPSRAPGGCLGGHPVGKKAWASQLAGSHKGCCRSPFLALRNVSLGRAQVLACHGFPASSAPVMLLLWAGQLPLWTILLCLRITDHPLWGTWISPPVTRAFQPQEGKISSTRQHRPRTCGVGPRSFSLDPKSPNIQPV